MSVDLVGPHEVAERLGVRVQTVHMWRARGRLPEPGWTISGVPIWEWTTVEGWARASGRLA